MKTEQITPSIGRPPEIIIDAPQLADAMSTISLDRGRIRALELVMGNRAVYRLSILWPRETEQCHQQRYA